MPYEQDDEWSDRPVRIFMVVLFDSESIYPSVSFTYTIQSHVPFIALFEVVRYASKYPFEASIEGELFVSQSQLSDDCEVSVSDEP